MAVARAPVRISLGGGGTDLPSYYRKHGGELIAGAINLFQYAAVTSIPEPEYRVSWEGTECAVLGSELSNPLIREAIAVRELPPGIQIRSYGDVRSGTGLGSSGAFTVALLKAFNAEFGTPYSSAVDERESLAREASMIEIDRCQIPSGKQDQYVSSYSGIARYTFHEDDTVDVAPLNLSPETLLALSQRLLLFFTGFRRSGHAALREQKERTEALDPRMIENLHLTKELGIASHEALRKGSVREFGEIMDVHWENKLKRSTNIANPEIVATYSIARRNGAVGGKLIGGGGGGYLLLVADDPPQLRGAMSELGLREQQFQFHFSGPEILSHCGDVHAFG